MDLKPENIESAHPATGNLVRRCRQLLAKDGLSAGIEELVEEKAAFPREENSPERTHLSFAQIHLAERREAFLQSDYLLFVLLEFPAGAGQSSLIFRIFNPETLRSATRFSGQGSSMEGIRIAETEAMPAKISMALYKVTRNDRNQRLVEVLDRLAGALNFEGDARGSVLLAHSILDRLEILTGFNDVSPLFGADGLETTPAPPGNIYWAVFPQDQQPPEDQSLWIKNRILHLGKTLATAAPLDTRNFLLLRIGDRPGPQSQIRYIHELRRQYVLSNAVAGLPVDDQGENVLSREARIRKERRLERLKKKYWHESQSYSMLQVVTPLAVEVAADLMHLFTKGSSGSLSAAAQEKINALREKFFLEWGVRMPALRVRGNETDMPPWSYLIMVNEVPLVMGTITNKSVLADVPPETLSALGINGKPAINPYDRSECSWLDSSQIDILKKHGLPYLESLDYVLLHLAAVVRSNLSRFLGVEEVSNLLTSHNPELLRRLRQSGGGLLLFTGILRTLLEEEVPITSLEAIGEKFIACTHSAMPPYAILEEIRLLEPVRGQLKGNDGKLVHFYTLGDTFAETIRKGVVTGPDYRLLALEPETTQALLSAVRTEVEAPHKDLILVEDWPSRAPLRRLLELEFPDLAVLSRRELLPGLGLVHRAQFDL